MNTLRTACRAVPFAALAWLGAGCMLDSELAKCENAARCAKAEVRAKVRAISQMQSYRRDLRLAIQAGATLGEQANLAEELRQCGFEIVSSDRGTLRLLLDSSPSDPAAGSADPDPVTMSRLARAAAVLRRRLPDHELSLESRDIATAVRAVRALHERAGVPGSAMRAAVGATSGLVVEVRPTRMESLEEVLAATME